MKNRLKKEGNESVTNCNQLKLLAADGKRYLTDVADQEQLFRASAKIAKEGGAIAGNTRREIEQRLGHSVISSAKATDYLPASDIQEIEE